MNRTAWPMFGIAALCIIAITVLVGTNNVVPGVLETVLVAALTGGAGITIPTTNSPSAAATRTLFGRKIVPAPAPVAPGDTVAATPAESPPTTP